MHKQHGCILSHSGELLSKTFILLLLRMSAYVYAGLCDSENRPLKQASL